MHVLSKPDIGDLPLRHSHMQLLRAMLRLQGQCLFGKPGALPMI